MVVTIVFYTSSGNQEIMDLCETEEELKRITVLQLKEKIGQRTGYPPERVGLIFRSEILKDDRLLTEYGIRHMSRIYFITELITAGGGGYDPGKGDGGMGDKGGKNRSMERLSYF